MANGSERHEAIRIIITNNLDPWPKRLAKAVASVALVVAVFWGPGLLLDSAAMQWAGFIAFWSLVALAVARWPDQSLTIAQAREKLDALEREQSK